MSATYQSHVSASTPSVGGLIPFFGLPCILVSLYNAICKPTKRSDSYGVCTSNEFECLHFAPVLKSSTQCLVVDTKMSFPPDENNPCIITLCFCTIFYQNQLNLSFFKKVQELAGHKAVLPF